MTAIPQHLQALESANRVRRLRYELKQQITAGDKTAASVILAPPEWTMTMPVLDVLMAQRSWGLRRGRKFLTVAQVRDGKLLGELTDRQRGVLADLLNWGTA